MLAAADRGIDVLWEKPLEITTDRIDCTIDAAEDAGITLGGVFQQRFTDVLQAVHDAADGRFGDLAVASLHYCNGALGQLLGVTSMYPGSSRRLRLGGRDGTVEVCEKELVTWEFRKERSTDEEISARFSSEDGPSGGLADPMDIDFSNHRQNVEAIETGEPYPLHATEARTAVAIVEAIYESAAKETPIRILNI